MADKLSAKNAILAVGKRRYENMTVNNDKMTL